MFRADLLEANNAVREANCLPPLDTTHNGKPVAETEGFRARVIGSYLNPDGELCHHVICEDGGSWTVPDSLYPVE
jgi:hypothetical protein